MNKPYMNHTMRNVELQDFDVNVGNVCYSDWILLKIWFDEKVEENPFFSTKGTELLRSYQSFVLSHFPEKKALGKIKFNALLEYAYRLKKMDVKRIKLADGFYFKSLMLKENFSVNI